MPAPVTGGRRRGASVKTLKRALKKAGLKTTGRKAALTRRAKKAHLKLRGGNEPEEIGTSSGPESFSPPGWGYKGSEEKKADKKAMEEEEKKEGGRHRRRHRSRKH